MGGIIFVIILVVIFVIVFLANNESDKPNVDIDINICSGCSNTSCDKTSCNKDKVEDKKI